MIGGTEVFNRVAASRRGWHEWTGADRSVGVTVPLMFGDTLEDRVGDLHRRQTLFTVDMRCSSGSDAVDEVCQLTGQCVGAGPIDRHGFHRHELAEDILLELFDVGTRLARQLQRRRSEPKSV